MKRNDTITSPEGLAWLKATEIDDEICGLLSFRLKNSYGDDGLLYLVVNGICHPHPATCGQVADFLDWFGKGFCYPTLED